jgi:hypothetical protein
VKLNADQIVEVQRQVGVDPVDADDPATETLRENFGDHTFYVGQEGLFVWEPAEGADGAEDPAVLVHVAEWSEDRDDALVSQEPKATDLVIDLAGGPVLKQDGGDGGAPEAE